MLYSLMKLSAFDISLLYAMLVKILPADVGPSYRSLLSYTAKTLWSEGKMIIWLLEAEYTLIWSRRPMKYSKAKLYTLCIKHADKHYSAQKFRPADREMDDDTVALAMFPKLPRKAILEITFENGTSWNKVKRNLSDDGGCWCNLDVYGTQFDL